jgi:hydroxymethylpyrimidine/phosphomethylpyrimidine kinase
MREAPPRILSIAGSDSGGGAGIQADLKTFAAHLAYGMTVVTAVTAQNTREVTRLSMLPPEMVGAQMDAVFSDIGVDAVKIGMLGSREIIAAVAEGLERWVGPPIVLDPVMVAKSGDALLREDAREALIERLVPLATLVTPNLPEAEALTGEETTQEAGRSRAARAIVDLGPAVLVKGGHGGGNRVRDLLLEPGRDELWIEHPRVETRSTHGTGCTLSSAIAARLGAGHPLREAVEGAVAYLQGALTNAFALGHGQGPVNHLYRLERKP